MSQTGSKMKPDGTKRSILVIPSRIGPHPEEFEGAEETEIAAQITLPHEGGWAWVVLFSAFLSIVFLDGTSFTFGSVFMDLTKDIQSTGSAVAFINSIALGLYYMSSPFVSAFLNRFGFRAGLMTGSVLVSFSLLFTYFSKTYGAVCIFYGFLIGIGYSFINMSSLIVGFYFEKLRALAFAVISIASSLGVMVFYPVNDYIVTLAGWRVVILLQAGLNALSFFLGMTYRPLLSLTVTRITEDATRTVTFLPSLAAVKSDLSKTAKNIPEGLTTTPTERLFSAVSNVNFPTAATVLDEGVQITGIGPGPSRGPVAAKYNITAQAPQGGMSQLQIKQVKSIMANVETPTLNVVRTKESKKRKCWPRFRFCNWEEHIPQSRPMYRDDAFYDGKLDNLPAYQKSVLDTRPESKTGLEYQLAVTRTATTADIQERRGVFTTAARRILSTMMDPKFLKKFSFILVCLSGVFLNLGNFVPYVFIQDRNLSYGLDPHHCSLFVTAIGFMNAVGKLVIGTFASKIDPLKIYIVISIAAGISMVASDFSKNLVYQYLFSCVFGFCISPTASLRSLVLVKLYGLENLTNTTGILLLFQGLGCFISIPAASIAMEKFGYKAAFIGAGISVIISGVLLFPVQRIVNKENIA